MWQLSAHSFPMIFLKRSLILPSNMEWKRYTKKSSFLPCQWCKLKFDCFWHFKTVQNYICDNYLPTDFLWYIYVSCHSSCHKMYCMKQTHYTQKKTSKVIFYAVSVSKNQFRFECPSTGRQHFEIWTDFYALTLQKNDF